MDHDLPHWDWSVAAIAGAVATAMPAVVRFVPILQSPKVQQIVLKVMLVLAGLVIPLAALALFYVFLDLGQTDLNLLVGLVVLFFFVSVLILNINLTDRTGFTVTSWPGPSSSTARQTASPNRSSNSIPHAARPTISSIRR